MSRFGYMDRGKPPPARVWDWLRADELQPGDQVTHRRGMRPWVPVRTVAAVTPDGTHVLVSWRGGQAPTRMPRGTSVRTGMLR